MLVNLYVNLHQFTYPVPNLAATKRSWEILCLLKFSMTSPKKMDGQDGSLAQLDNVDDLPGDQLQEGKTKIIYSHSETTVYIQSKDRISANNAQRVNDLEGKAAISTATTCKVFEFLEQAGLKTAFLRRVNDLAFIAQKCSMIPIEWVTRRTATGSFLKRHDGVQEGYRFSPPKLELFFKDDAAGDPQWSEEQLIAKKFDCNRVVIGAHEVAVMSRATVLIFEVLEKAWGSLDCSLIDMKIEFGVNTKGEIVLADVIDSDSWRLWPSGDKRLMKDKQVYRNLKVVTDDALQQVKRNFQWVADKLDLIIPKSSGMAVVLMGSESDLPHCQMIKEACTKLGVPCEMRITSAHKGTDETLEILAHYEGLAVPLVFIAVAGRSNGLGPVLSGNTTYPVINCPPLKADWGSQDVWSSLRLPSGLGCALVMSPEAAALNAAQILGLDNHLIWSRLRVKQYNTWLGLKEADRRLQTS